MRGRPNHRVGGGSHLGHRGHLGSLSHQSYLGHLSEEEQGVGVTDGDSSWGELLDEGLMLVIAVVRGATEHRSEFYRSATECRSSLLQSNSGRPDN